MTSIEIPDQVITADYEVKDRNVDWTEYEYFGIVCFNGIEVFRTPTAVSDSHAAEESALILFALKLKELLK